MTDQSLEGNAGAGDAVLAAAPARYTALHDSNRGFGVVGGGVCVRRGEEDSGESCRCHHV